MRFPDTLPERLYLLAMRPGHAVPAQAADLGVILRAAALTDLHLRGLLVDEGGRPAATGSVPASLSPLLADPLDAIAKAAPRPWRRWVETGHHGLAGTVRARLVEDGRLDLAERRVLGLFPLRVPTPTDPDLPDALRAGLLAALEGTGGAVEPEQAAVVALAAVSRLRTVLPYRLRREHRARLEELTAAAGPVPQALRRVLRTRRAARSS
ncbi:GPP34 family phosphoprotein [Streptomyces sp. PTM05]|uniref:GPP34 family phosphoprotein n=1 Tax=Streptantibioticus parmotrematis TaxID=2873249 RepID=A0ABS7QQI9_9ACTN|nr:GPP34 family phosphoprotein [Streptantibioticus parmotrematis]MBY8885198.1 GPP34 family phosphoprotein [Streptantibioticus parmotrematis]